MKINNLSQRIFVGIRDVIFQNADKLIENFFLFIRKTSKVR